MTALELHPAERPTAGSLNIQVENTFQNVTCSQAEWDEATVRLGGNVYHSYDWARIWWEFYGRGRQLRIFIFTLDGEIVAIVPLYLDTLGLWPFHFKVARLVGANVPPKAFSPPVREDYASLVWERILEHLFRRDGCDLLSFGPVSALYQPAHVLEQSARSRSSLVGSVNRIPVGVHTLFSLPRTLDAYFDGLNKSERKKRQYELRLLRRECQVVEDTLREPGAVQMEFGRFVEQHSLQWRAEGKPGHFGAWPRAAGFNEALVAAQARHGRVRFSRIIADGQLVSTQFSFAFGDCYYWELPARETGKKWDRLSLGPAGAISMFEAAISEGFTRVEGGLGHYEYKLRLGGVQHPVNLIRIRATGWFSRLRFCCFDAIRRCVLLGYHKLWYRRITPRLPERFRKPQWNLWLRLDF